MTTEKTAPAEPIETTHSTRGSAQRARRRSWLVFARDVIIIVIVQLVQWLGNSLARRALRR